MSRPKLHKVCTALSCTLAVAALGLAHVRLTHPGTNNPLYWGDPTRISIVSSSIGSDDIADKSEETALRNAIDAWNDATGTSAYLVEDSSAASQARTDWQSSDLHLIWFDEADSSGYFPGSSGTVAITPIWFFSNGRIDDADVIFNGKNFAFTTSGESAKFDVQDVAAHELGHLLGLDHSGWAGATMYPFVDSTVILHRSLGLDDVHGLRAAYPQGSHASIAGTVKRSSDSSIVAGAHVVVRDSSGRTAGAALADASGAFTVLGLDAGQYQLYVSPLDFPVSVANLGAGWTVHTDFEATEQGNVTVTAGQAANAGDLFVDPDVTISLGRNTDRYPLRCPSGQMSIHVARGTGLASGSTLTASDPSIVVNPINWFGTQVSFNVTVPSGAALGHVDLIATTAGGDRSVLVAGLEVTPPDPTVSFVSPNQGQIEGGLAVTLTGTNFNAGARVVMGGEIYEDGAVGGCTVVDSNTITLTTRASVPGVSDVVVIDASGVEGRKLSSFQFLAVPQLSTIFPTAGDIDGGTTVTLRGENFIEGLVVRVGGVTQPNVTIVSTQKLTFQTTPGASTGTKTVEVENVGGAIALLQYSFVNSNDPSISSVTPAIGPLTGGDAVTISGTNFSSSSQVFFGADADTGLGGTLAENIVFVDSNTLTLTTPAMQGGLASLLVTGEGSGQADLLASGFNFTGGGGGGGGCAAITKVGPPAARDVLGSVIWFALLLVAVRPRRRRPALARVRAC